MINDYQARKIGKVTSNKRPSRLLFLDTETKVKRVHETADGVIITDGWDDYLYQVQYRDIDLHRFDLGWTCFETYEKDKGFFNPEWFLWHDTQKLCEYIESLAIPKKELHLFGHNIFFDLQAGDFFYWFTRWGWLLDFIYDKGTTYILSIHKNRRRIKCISTTNYFPFTLKRLGTFLRLPKLDIDFDSSSRFEKVTYCKRDTEIIKRVIEYYIRFLDKHNLGKFCLTRPSQALTAYRYRFMHKAIYKHKNSDIIAIESASYCGGRVECGFIGDLPENDYVTLDINSMYPFVMQKYKLPVKLVDFQEHVSVADLEWKLKTHACIAEVLIDTKEPVYSLKRGGKLIFPTGSFTTTLCTGSLVRAFKRNEIRAVNKLLLYDTAFLFNDYVSFFMQLKEKYSKENNLILRNITKYFLLHLYGKFAQQKDITEAIEDVTCDGYYREETLDLVTGQTEVVTKLFNKKIITFGREPSTCYFVSIPSHITDYARLYLYSLMKKVGLDRVLYVDTDSLTLRKEDVFRLGKYLDDYRLGALKVEAEFRKYSIYGAKYYITEKGKKIKGIPLKAEYLGDYKYKYTLFAKQPTHLRAQVTRFFITKPIEKVVRPFYDKGNVAADGKVTPFNLSI